MVNSRFFLVSILFKNNKQFLGQLNAGRSSHEIIHFGSTVFVVGGFGMFEGRIENTDKKVPEPLPTEKCTLHYFGRKTKFICEETTSILAGWYDVPVLYAVPKDWQCNP